MDFTISEFLKYLELFEVIEKLVRGPRSLVPQVDQDSYSAFIAVHLLTMSGTGIDTLIQLCSSCSKESKKKKKKQFLY